MLSVQRYETSGNPIYMSEALAKKLAVFLPYFGEFALAPCVIVTSRDFLRRETSKYDGITRYEIDDFLLRHDGSFIDFPTDSEKHIAPVANDMCVYDTSSHEQISHLIYTGKCLNIPVEETATEIAVVPKGFFKAGQIPGNKLSWYIISILHELAHTHEKLTATQLESKHNQAIFNEIGADRLAIKWYNSMVADGLPLHPAVPQTLRNLRAIGILTHHLHNKSFPDDSDQYIHFPEQLFHNGSLRDQDISQMDESAAELVTMLNDFATSVDNIGGYSSIELSDDDERLLMARMLYHRPQMIAPYLEYFIERQTTVELTSPQQSLCDNFLKAAQHLDMLPPAELLQDIQASIRAAKEYLEASPVMRRLAL